MHHWKHQPQASGSKPHKSLFGRHNPTAPPDSTSYRLPPPPLHLSHGNFIQSGEYFPYADRIASGSSHSSDSYPPGFTFATNKRQWPSSPHIQHNSDGSVSAGTLDGLINRLLDEEIVNSETASEYRDVYLMTYSAFTTSEYLFNSLVRRFEEADTTRMSPESRVEIKCSVVSVMKQWLLSYYAEVPRNVLTQMETFAANLSSSYTSKELSKEISRAVGIRKAWLRSQEQPRRHACWTLANVDELSNALNYLEAENYRHINAPAYIGYIRNTSAGCDVAHALSTHKKIVYWVMQTILQFDALEVRASKFVYFVRIAQKCLYSYNFSSMSAILDALQSSIVTRVCPPRELLSSDIKQSLDYMGDLLEPSSHNKVYREALAQSRGVAIPWLDVHVNDMRRFWSHPNNPDTVMINGQELINFSKYVEFRGFLEVLQYKAPMCSEEGPLLSVQKALNAIVPDLATEAHYEKRVQDLEAMERSLRKSKGRELASLGFDWQPHHLHPPVRGGTW